ncbi:MAG TPA: chloride channel protein [Vicinamibacterales bacterium]|nr:chloride channel protein [Vicinamibacterales bacterium]
MDASPTVNQTPTSRLRPWLRKYTALVHQDLAATYSRDLHKWLIVAPIIGVVTGLVITLIARIILYWMWPLVLAAYLHHRLLIVPGLVGGFVVAGLIMQYLTPDPDEHSTEEIIRSYHEHQGDVQMRPVVPKLLAAIATVGSGGSAALEGPSIYGGGALGSWLWTKLRRVGLEPRDRRIMLISGAAAGMAAVFRAPLTGLVFALEMPYKDDLAHEALLPSLIASVVSYITLASFLGAQPLFDFAAGATFTERDLFWSALLGLICGLVAMAFTITFRRFRTFVVGLSVPHWVKMAAGGALTGICGLAFVGIFNGSLIPLGPNYEAVPDILLHHHGSLELVAFGVFKLAATLFSLGVGGVSAMFVPLFLTGGAFGVAFAQSIAHSPVIDLYAAVGMAAFIAAGYKTPLTAVVFVAEATGGHAYIIPALIGAAVASAVSGEASASGDQRLHEGVKVSELRAVPVREAMQSQVLSVDASLTVRAFAERVGARRRLHAVYPVLEEGRPVGVIPMRALARVPVERWNQATIGELTDRQVTRVPPDCDLMEALRLLTSRSGQHLLLVTSADGRLDGIVTKSDILRALTTRGAPEPAPV